MANNYYSANSYAPHCSHINEMREIMIDLRLMLNRRIDDLVSLKHAL